MKYFLTIIITVIVCFFLFQFIYNNYLKDKNDAQNPEELGSKEPTLIEESKHEGIPSNIRLISYYYPDVIYTQYLKYYDKIFEDDIWHRNIFTVTVENKGNNFESILLEAEIPEYSYESWEMFSISPGSKDIIGITPELIHSSLYEIDELTSVPLKIKVKKIEEGNEVLLIEDVFNIQLASKNTAVFQLRNEKRNKVIDLSPYICVWVTPNCDEIQDILRTAADFHPNNAIAGYQRFGGLDKADIVREQVKAVYKALQELDILYISSPVSFGGGQKIKFPKEIIDTQSANCIEGVILMASVLEAIGLEPLIVLIHEHAFLGWKTWMDSSECEFLETSYIWSSQEINFKAALKEGIELFKEEEANGNFEKGKSKVIDIRKVREEMDITPFSYDYF